MPWKKLYGLLGAPQRQLWVRGFSSALRTAQDGTARHGTVLPTPALPFHRPDLLLLHRSASLPTLLPVAHWVGSGLLVCLFSAGMFHFEVPVCDFHLRSMVGCRGKLKPKLQCLRHFNLPGTKVEELNPGKKVGPELRDKLLFPICKGQLLSTKICHVY